MDLLIISSSLVKHGGGGAMAWACMAVSESSQSINLYFNVTHNGGGTINSEDHRNILSSNLQKNVKFPQLDA